MSLSGALLAALASKGDRHRAGKAELSPQGVKEGDPKCLGSLQDSVYPSPGKEGDTGEAQLKFCSYLVH